MWDQMSGFVSMRERKKVGEEKKKRLRKEKEREG